MMMVSSRILAALAIALRVDFDQLPGHVNGRICLPLPLNSELYLTVCTVQ